MNRNQPKIPAEQTPPLSRAQRIADAQASLDRLAPEYKALQKRWNEAHLALRRAEEGYDSGERVAVIETCRRGCCVEADYEGVVVGEQDNGTWIVRDFAGTTHPRVSHLDMTRIPSEPS